MINNKKRGLIIAYNGLGNSGVPNLIFQVIKALSNEYLFDVLVFDDSNYYYNALEQLNAQIIRYPEIRQKSKIKRIIEYFFKRDKNYYNFCKKLIEKNSYDSVHSFKESDSAPFFKAAKDCNVKKIIYHCTVIQDGPKNPLTHLIFKIKMHKSLKLSNIKIGVSQKCCKIAFSKHNSFILHNSYNESFYSYKDVSPSAGIKLLHISSFSDNKNQLFSAQVLKNLNEITQDCSLVFVGDSGDEAYKNKVLSFVDKNDLKEKVSFVNTEQIKTIMQDVAYYILPSKKEGASIVTIEAQAQGIKVFASDSLSSDMNIGGCVFLNLKKGANYWAKEIYNYYNKNGTKRQKYNTDPFSSKRFEEDIKRIYKVD